MTLYRRTAVGCDVEGCKEMVVDDGTEARRFARRQGWALVRRKGRQVDLCPAHKGMSP